MNKLVSIIIPAYNRATRIEAAIKSIQSQTYLNWEIIISDDGSTDNTQEFVKKFIDQDKRIRFVRNEINQGAQAARNRGIKAAQGEWIAFLDSDDQWLPDSLEKRLNAAKQENATVVHSGAYIQHKDKPLEIYHLPRWKGYIYKDVLGKEGPTFPSLLIEKAALEKIGYLDEQVVAYQEWDTSIRLAKFFSFACVPEPTFIYDYTSSDSISRNSLRNAKGYSYIFHKHFKDILFHLGPGAIGYHYEVIANWYRGGGDEVSAKRNKIKATIWKFMSPTIVLRKIKNMLTKNK